MKISRADTFTDSAIRKDYESTDNQAPGYVSTDTLPPRAASEGKEGVKGRKGSGLAIEQ